MLRFIGTTVPYTIKGVLRLYADRYAKSLFLTMPRARPLGPCHICGTVTRLTKEHTPPQAAFNNSRAYVVKVGDTLTLGPNAVARGKQIQGGIGSYTLCGKCNNDTGGWYGGSFVDWCYKAMEILERSGGNPRLVYFYNLYPLRVLKQIVTMFFSLEPPEFASHNPDLVRFVLNKESRYLPPKYHIYVYYNISGLIRMTGPTGQIDIHGNPPRLQNEFSYPPFGYVMTIDTVPQETRLLEITSFKDYFYDELGRREMGLSVLPTNTWIPGDYRTLDEIATDRANYDESDFA